MLKITTRKNGLNTIVELEGKLAGPWVEELECCWQAIGSSQPIIVRLQAVTFIDSGGKELLTRIRRRGGKLVAQGCMTKAIVEEINRQENEKAY